MNINKVWHEISAVIIGNLFIHSIPKLHRLLKTQQRGSTSKLNKKRHCKHVSKYDSAVVLFLYCLTGYMRIYWSQLSERFSCKNTHTHKQSCLNFYYLSWQVKSFVTINPFLAIGFYCDNKSYYSAFIQHDVSDLGPISASDEDQSWVLNSVRATLTCRSITLEIWGRFSSRSA